MTHGNTTIELPAWALAALRTLEGAGFEAWFVGGCVRDQLLGRPVNDFDMATDAPWQDAARAFREAGCTVHETGTAHGTVTAVADGHALEVTTYRTDGAYTDGRHPDSVTFVRSLEEDLARRDFAMNALAYHPERGMVDLFGGIDDLRAGRIRAIGDASARFKEDALRILRACRFASQLGFSIDPGTLEAMVSHKMLLWRIAWERITHELELFLLGDHVHDALMETFDVLVAVLPEMAAMKGFQQHTPYHIYDVLEHTAYVLQNTPPYPLVRWAALLHDAGKPAAFFRDGEVGHFYGHAKASVAIARGLLGRMALSPAFAADVLELVRIHDDAVQPTPKSVKRALVRLDGRVDLFRALCDLKRADALSQAPRCAPRAELACELARTLDAVLAAGEPFALKDLAIDGRDVMSLGVAEGPQVGALLREALMAVVDGDVPNDPDALREFVAAKAAAGGQDR